MTVFTNGCFDLIHSGHIHTLQEARKMGDRLIVAINSDESVARLKGDGRPLVPLPERIAVLKAIGCVDEVIPFWEDTPEKIIWAVRPHIIVKGSDWRGRPVAGEEFAEVRFVDNIPGYSTTSLIRRIISSYEEGLIDAEGNSTGRAREPRFISEK